jgi:lysophospholipase L1-like esterase
LPWLGQWRHLGIESACVAGEEAVEQARRESAEAHGAIFVSAMDVFAGPEHDQDPVEKGWIAEDGMHLNADGVAVLVDALASVGFDPSEPPN